MPACSQVEKNCSASRNLTEVMKRGGRAQNNKILKSKALKTMQ